MNDDCRTCFADAHVNGSRRQESWCLVLKGGCYDAKNAKKRCPFYKKAGTTATMAEREAACRKYSETHSISRK